MARKGITNSEKALIRESLLYGAMKGKTWGDIVDEQIKREKELEEDKNNKAK